MTTYRGSSPRHRELAQLAIRRAETMSEPLVEAIAWAIDAALCEVTGIADLTADGRCRNLPRALAILRLRGSLTPIELGKAIGWRNRHQAWYTLQRLVDRGHARRSLRGRYVPAAPIAVGRPTTASRKAS